MRNLVLQLFQESIAPPNPPPRQPLTRHVPWGIIAQEGLRRLLHVPFQRVRTVHKDLLLTPGLCVHLEGGVLVVAKAQMTVLLLVEGTVHREVTLPLELFARRVTTALGALQISSLVPRHCRGTTAQVDQVLLNL